MTDSRMFNVWRLKLSPVRIWIIDKFLLPPAPSDTRLSSLSRYSVNDGSDGWKFSGQTWSEVGSEGISQRRISQYHVTSEMRCASQTWWKHSVLLYYLAFWHDATVWSTTRSYKLFMSKRMMSCFISYFAPFLTYCMMRERSPPINISSASGGLSCLKV